MVQIERFVKHFKELELMGISYFSTGDKITVEEGDTLDTIALGTGIPSDKLYQQNKGQLGDDPEHPTLTPGQVLEYVPPGRMLRGMSII